VFVDMADGIPNEEVTQRLMQFSDTFREQAVNIQNMSEREFNNFLVSVRDDLEASGEIMGDGFQSILAGVPGLAEAFDSMTELQKRRILGEEEYRKLQEKQRQAAARDDSILQFEETLNRIRGNLQVAFVESGILQVVEDLAAEFADFLSNPKTIEGLKSALVSVSTFLNNFITDLKTVGIKDSIKNMFKNVADAFLDFFLGPDTIKQPGMGEVDVEREDGFWQEMLKPLMDQAVDALVTAVTSWWDSNSLFTQTMIAGAAALFLGGGPLAKAFITGITSLFASSAIKKAITGGAGSAVPDGDKDKNKSKKRFRLPKGLKGAGILGAILGAVELGSILTDESLNKDEKIEQGSSTAGGIGGAAAGAAAGAIAGSMVPIIGNVIGGLIGGGLGYFGGSWAGGKVGESITTSSDREMFDLSEIDPANLNNTAKQFKEYENIDSNALKSAKEGIVAISEALTAFNEAVSINGMANFASRLAGTDDFVDGLLKLSNGFGNIDVTQIQNSLPGMESLAEIIGVYKNSIALESFGDFASRLVGTDDFVNGLVSLTQGLEPIDGNKLQNVAPGVEAVSKALEVFKSSTGFQGLSDLVSRWFSEDAVQVGAKIAQIATDLSVMNPSQVTSVSKSIEDMSRAFTAFSDAQVEDFNFKYSAINRFERLAQLGPGLESVSTHMTDIAGITGLDSQLEVLNDGLDVDKVNNYAEAMEKLVEVLEDLNKALAEDNQGLFGGTGVAASDVIENMNTVNQGSSDAIQELNSTMMQVLAVLRQTKTIDEKIAKNTSSMGGNIANGRVSNIR